MQENNYYEVNRLSASDIKLISESIPHWLAYRNVLATPEMAFGTAFHCFILEPEKFNNIYVIDTFNKRTNEGKARIEELKAEGQILLSTYDYELIQQMTNSYMKLQLNYHRGIVEEPIYFDYLNVECKAKPDVMQPENNLIIDFKTISDASDANVAYSIRKYKYYIQEAFYTLATNLQRFIFVFIEKKAPFGVRIVELQSTWRLQAIEEINNAIEKYKLYKQGYEELPYELFLTI